MSNKFAFLFMCLYMLYLPTRATHVIGGEITYRYIGNNGPTDRPFRYSIRFVGYADRSNGSNYMCGNIGNRPLLGIYDATFNRHIPRKTGTTPEDKFWLLPSHGPIGPNGPCPINPYIFPAMRPLIVPDSLACYTLSTPMDIAITDTTFEVQLPLSAVGYYLRYENCCRTPNTTNLSFSSEDPGNAWLAFIPSPIYLNSSPQFTSDICPVICKGDTAFLSQTATDPDGDRLVFSFARPYSGRSLVASMDTFSAQTNVTYANGFSQNQPFGASGYTYINPTNGRCKFYNPTNGTYAIAIDVQEYRVLAGGQEILLSTTRREQTITVLNPTEVVKQTKSTYPVNLFPNPAKENLTLQTQVKILQSSLVDLFGKEIPIALSVDNQAEISHIKPGLYLVKVQTSEGLYLDKLIKQ